MAETSDAARPCDIWPVWRALVRALPVARMPWEWFFSPSVWTLFGLDYLSGLRRNRTTRAVFAILEPLGPAELRRAHALAHLNNRRHEVISRWMAIGFVTLPASAALTLSQLSPETLEAVGRWQGAASWPLLLGYIAAVVAFYLLCAWRARQLLTLVELAMIQRGVSLHGADEPLDDPLAEPMGT